MPKTASQLQREIDEALARRQAHSTKPRMVDLSTPYEERYQTPDGSVTVAKAKRGLWMVHPRGREPLPMTSSKQKAFDAALRWSAGKASDQQMTTRSKRSASPSVIGSHELGTYDVSTAEGAYWIVPTPTGYRVDYKPWGPSNEIDLGSTFTSLQQARAAITKHHRDLLRGRAFPDEGGTKRQHSTRSTGAAAQPAEIADAWTWHHGPKAGPDPAVVVHSSAGRSVYTYSHDLDRNDQVRTYFQHVRGPILDEDTLDELASQLDRYDYSPSMAKRYRKA